MSRRTRHIGAAIALAAASTVLHAQSSAGLHGTVRDPLGAIVRGAKVQLLKGPTVVGEATANEDGQYTLALPGSGRYSLRVSAPTFQANTTAPHYFRATTQSLLDLTVATPTDTQQITVSATGVDTPEAQIGASITVLPHDDFRFMTEIQTPLRLIPGVQVTQVGQVGGSSGLNIRGGDTSANKVLIDGTPADQIGGAVEFANLATVGIDRVEVLREPNSALYGSDALAGVISLTTPRGSTHLPLFTYAGDAGNFGTYRNEVTAGTAYKQFDLFSAFARLDTRNNLPDSQFHNATYAGNFGWTPNASNDVRFTVHHVVVSGGQPNAVALDGVAEPDQQTEHDNYYSGVWNTQTTPRWHNQIRYGGLRLNGSFNNFGAAGVPDGFGDYDGLPVTITGANGYSVSGQAYLQFGNTPYRYLETTKRDFVYAQSDYQLSPHFLALGAFKFEGESGGDGDAGTTPTTISRGNYSYTLQFSGDLHNRLFYSLGTGLEDNGLFGFAGTPRASLAYYLIRPGASGRFTGTKLHGTFAKGIREPSVFQQTDSLNGVLTMSGLSTAGAPPLGPQSSRTYDAGLDQQLFNGAARVGITYFHNQFTGVPEYVPQSELKQLYPGVNLSLTPYGAYINSLAFRSEGVELESEFRFGNHVSARAGYTYTSAVVENSFSTASFNTASNFSTVAIGAYGPLAGARPFRIAPHTGYFQLDYHRSKFTTNLSGTLVGRRDDSTFLSDSNFGNTLLLPNRNLDGAYQRLELGGSYQLTPRIQLYSNIQNLLSEHYYEAFGYPALPLTFRSGLKINFGGESWKLK
jgi:iron complex outermembrane receptor protein/vitamin B12 transporter